MAWCFTAHKDGPKKSQKQGPHSWHSPIQTVQHQYMALLPTDIYGRARKALGRCSPARGGTDTSEAIQKIARGVNPLLR